ncbi:MAG: 30S ribosomal protein S20 [Chloroflexota bacterium]
MPVTKSAEKRMRATPKRRLRNKSASSLSKTNITKAEKAVFTGQLEVAQTEVKAAISSLDKAVKKGIIHPNNAARRKSRLVRKLNRATAPASAETKPAKTG